MNLQRLATFLQSLGLLTTVFYANGLAATISNDIFQDTKSPPLHDFAHRFLPYIESADLVANFVLLVMIAIATVIAGIEWEQVYPDVLANYFSTAAATFALRAVCIVITSVPPAYLNSTTKCMATTDGPMQFFARPIMMLVEIVNMSNPRVVCGDNVFSGHSSAMIILGDFVSSRFPINIRMFVKKLCYVPTALVMFALLLGRMHYTLDLILAIVLSEGVLHIWRLSFVI